MKSLHAAVDIDAPAERVWQVVGDFGRYPDWKRRRSALSSRGHRHTI